MDRESRELLTAAGFSAMGQLVAHWFPWNWATRKELPAPAAYVIGCSQIIGAFTVWAMRRDRLDGKRAVVGLTTITALNGCAVFAAYLIDGLLKRDSRDALAEREAAIYGGQRTNHHGATGDGYVNVRPGAARAI